MTIDLSRVDPRNYQHVIETALKNAGRIDAAIALHDAQPRPRDLIELYPLLPVDVYLNLWEVSSGAHNHA